jgi:hypothetical protein
MASECVNELSMKHVTQNFSAFFSRWILKEKGIIAHRDSLVEFPLEGRDGGAEKGGSLNQDTLTFSDLHLALINQSSAGF